jgi:DNA-binding transcriptional LysR family regulator
VPDKRLTVVPIHRDELIVITPPHHPLAGQNKATVAEVVEYPLLLPKVGRTRDALETLFHERKLKPRISMELDSSELLKRFVAADVGIGFIPRSHVAEDLQANALAALTLADASIQRDLALVFRKDKALSRAALAFIDIAVKLKAALPAAITAR